MHTLPLMYMYMYKSGRKGLAHMMYMYISLNIVWEVGIEFICTYLNSSALEVGYESTSADAIPHLSCSQQLNA